MPDPANWCWQGQMPSYAQAVTSNYAEFLYKGSLVMSDENTTYARGDTGGAAPLLWAGAPNIMCIVRKLDSSPAAFLVTLTVQKLSNAKNNLNKPEAAASVTIPGLVGARGKLAARPQGSVYVVRNDSANGTVTVYQIDKWHLPTHPMRWPTDMVEVEAELFEGHLGAAAAIVTEFPADAEDEHDWTRFTTFVDLPAATAGVQHRLQHDGDGSCSLVRVLARSGSVVLQFEPVSVAGPFPAAWLPLTSETVAADGDALDAWQWLVVPAPAGANCHRFQLHGNAQVDKIQLVLDKQRSK